MAKIKRTWDKKYIIVKDNIGEGGNAIVHLVKDNNGNKLAFKGIKYRENH